MVSEAATTISKDVQEILWGETQFLDAGSAEEIGARLVMAKPLSPVTVALKTRKKAKYPEKPRVDTMEMVDSIRPRGAGTEWAVVVDSPNRKEIAGYQHYGTATIPERPFMGVSDVVLPKVQSVVDRHGKWLERLFDGKPLPEMTLTIST